MKPEDKAKVQQALDALEFCLAHDRDHAIIMEQACEGLLQLLEAGPVQEPVDSMGMPLSCGKPLCSPGDHHPLCKLATPPAQPEQCEWCNGHGVLTGHAPDGSFDGVDCPHCAPPAQPTTKDSLTVDHGDELTIAYLDGVHTGKQLAKREWVGLTNDERFALEYTPQGVKRTPIEMSFAIESKLKEKNT
jgi:hypothetical protein